MTLFLRSLILGYGVAMSAAIWLSGSGLAIWVLLLAAWIGGSVLGLAFTAIGAWLWPAMPTRRSSFTATEEEFRVWDNDLVRELTHASLMRDSAIAPKPGLVRLNRAA